MKISYNWLKDYIETDAEAGSIGAMLTGCGLEVEDIYAYHSIPGGLQGVVVGEVLEAVKHPNADKLRVCKVNLGTEIKQIVCGAPNVAATQKVLVATVGCTVHPTQGEPFTIQKAKIRGEVSEGMICAEDELSLGQSHDGILVLPAHYEVGKPAAHYFEVYSDEVLEIGLTANRGDAASHLGVARDLYALGVHRKRHVLPTLELGAAPCSIAVTLEEGAGCLRYTGLEINHITVKPSPAWLQNKLKAIGLSPINNIVDATNYMLHSLGQPLHAFDADRIAGKSIQVRKAREGEKFTTLDKTERTLKGHECLICDAEKPLALAGVFGGIDSGITAQTQNIFIESAYFDSATIRKGAKAHGLNTDASFRFERGTDPNITLEALHDVAVLILEIAGGYIPGKMIDVYPQPVEDRIIRFDPIQSNKLIGKDIPAATQRDILHKLEITVHEHAPDNWELHVPPYRVDVERPVDITEEILRIYGLNNIEMGTAIRSAMTFSEDEPKMQMRNRLSNWLSNRGFLEIASNSLTRSAYYPEDKQQELVALLNPLSNDLNVMRATMLHSMLEAVQYNNNRRLSDLRLFESGKTYHRRGQAAQLSSYTELRHLSIALYGKKQPESWNNPKTEYGFFGLKATVEALLQKAGLDYLQFGTEESSELDHATTISYKKNRLGVMGSVRTETARKFDIDKPLWYADLDLDKICALAVALKFKLQPVSVFPAVRRDLALMIDESITYAQLEKIAAKTEPKLIRGMNAFDVYQGDKIEKGKKSYALSFVLQDESKTLTDEEIEGVMRRLVENFGKEAGAILRG